MCVFKSDYRSCTRIPTSSSRRWGRRKGGQKHLHTEVAFALGTLNQFEFKYQCKSSRLCSEKTHFPPIKPGLRCTTCLLCCFDIWNGWMWDSWKFIFSRWIFFKCELLRFFGCLSNFDPLIVWWMSGLPKCPQSQSQDCLWRLFWISVRRILNICTISPAVALFEVQTA